jgi:hypothetical protein
MEIFFKHLTLYKLTHNLYTMLKAQIEEQPERNGQINFLKTIIKRPTLIRGKNNLCQYLQEE